MSELLRIFRYVRPYWLSLLASVLLMAFAGAAHGLIALLIKPIFNNALNPHSQETSVQLLDVPFLHWSLYLNDIMPASIHDVWTMTASAVLFAFLLRGLADYFGNLLINRVGLNSVTDLRQQIFDHVLRQDAQFFDTTSTGQLMSSIMNDIDKIQVATSHILADWLRQTFVALGLLIVIVQNDWKLAVFSLTVLPIVMLPTARLGRRIRRSTRRAQDDTAELNQILQETISGHQVVKSFGAEHFESNRFREAAMRLRRSNLKYVAQQAIGSPLIEFLGAATIVALVSYARTQITQGRMSTGEFTSFVIALLMLYEPVKRLVGIHNIFQQALGASQKVFEYLERPILIAEKTDAKEIKRFQRSIRFEDVSFRYPNAPEGFLLDGVTLEVQAGQIVALVGPSGAGKSTLASLLPRFYDATRGAIRIDGVDVRDLQIASLRAKISIVAQDTFLFNTTLRENIGYGRPGASEEEIREAATNALALEFIEQLPDGFETVIGERGTRLSGGQRQRIAIARALLENAPILILDEATSHLDTESEVLVQRALSNLIAGRTVIVVAHRLSTIRRADLIVVLDRGKIVETGKHEELVAAGGIYQRLHELQFLETGNS
ncbi:MAG TPA: ABC transporter transmembrane domain-containing protein [Bryobacteraceae bacterium]|nr:ABC transporter transmembrane domain-containing protein [Bryobacteraceae bacterium]